jgi:hypothetical protein
VDRDRGSWNLFAVWLVNSAHPTMASAAKASLKKPKEINIKVFVRVRPLNGIELAHNEDMAAEYDELRSEITFPGAKPWTFDRVYGVDTQQGPFYMDVAEDVVKSCLDGFNGTVFAYGQTGAGKSWSMEGSKDEPGIQARAMKQLFASVDDIKKAHPEQTCTVRCSYLEIYNDAVHDLLDGPEHAADDEHRRRTTKHHGEDGNASRSRAATGKGHHPSTADSAGNAPTKRIREDVKSHSFIVQDLTERAVESWEEVETHLMLGNSRRAVGSTNMNAVSSRSHAIFTCRIVRDYGVIKPSGSAAAAAAADAADATAAAAGGGGGGSAAKKKQASAITTAKLNLVDLAGSERGAKTGAKGARAKEGSHINKSLSALGDVITALEKKALKGNSKEHIPYRNSALTKLLADSLGGNSRTVMVAALGPAASNVEESISTLRFAARVKAVKNKPQVNEDAKDKRLRELNEENLRLIHDKEEAEAAARNAHKRDVEVMVQSVKGKILNKALLKRLEKRDRLAAEERASLESLKDEEINRLKGEHKAELARANFARALAAKGKAAAEASLEEAERRHQATAEAAEKEKEALAAAEAKASAKARAADAASADAQERLAEATEAAVAAGEQAAAAAAAAAAAEGRAERAETALREMREAEAARAAAAASDAVAAAAEKEAAERKWEDERNAAAAALEETKAEAAVAAAHAAAEAATAAAEVEGKLRGAQEAAKAQEQRADDASNKLQELRTVSKMMAQKSAELEAKLSSDAVAAAAEREAAERKWEEESASAATALEDAKAEAAAAAAKAAAEAAAAASEAEAKLRAEETRAAAEAARAAAAERQVQELRDEARAVAAAALAEKQKLADEAAAKVAACAAAGASAQGEEAQRADREYIIYDHMIK